MYKLLFFILVAFILGRASVGFKIYVGYDKDKYNAANLGILLQ